MVGKTDFNMHCGSACWKNTQNRLGKNQLYQPYSNFDGPILNMYILLNIVYILAIIIMAILARPNKCMWQIDFQVRI